jgi:general secretion pathway protein I
MADKNVGFTLLEVMVAMAIISIVLTAVYKMHGQTLIMSETARFYTLAPMLAQSKMAEFDIKPTKDQDNDSGNFGYEYPGYRWEIAVEETKIPITSSADRKKPGKKATKSDAAKSEKKQTKESEKPKPKSKTDKPSEFAKKILMKKVDITISLRDEFRYAFRTYRLAEDEDDKKK